MRHRPHPAPPLTAALTDESQPGYDWARFGRHRLRTPAAVVIDAPFPFGPSTWMATIWPDSQVAAGWSRLLWHPDPGLGRGWAIPASLALADIIEFGSHGSPERWYGIVDSYDVAAWLTVQGPYPHPAVAYADAERLLAAERYLPPLHAEPPATPKPARVDCSRRSRRP